VREDFWVWMVVRKDVVKVAGTAAAAILSFDSLWLDVARCFGYSRRIITCLILSILRYTLWMPSNFV
jgi:hypothetical protein